MSLCHTRCIRSIVLHTRTNLSKRNLERLWKHHPRQIANRRNRLLIQILCLNIRINSREIQHGRDNKIPLQRARIAHHLKRVPRKPDRVEITTGRAGGATNNNG